MAAPKLNQILAVEKGVRTDAAQVLTAQYHLLQKTQLLGGLDRTYRKLDDADPDLPGESTPVQVKVGEVTTTVVAALTRLFDVTAAKDWTNTHANADVVVDGKTLVRGAPVTYLLWLEKKLTDLETLVRKLPVLDPAEVWHYDDTTDTWRTGPVETTRTKKIPRNHVKVEATKEHPAQVEVYTEDVVVGYWRTVKSSGAAPAARVNELLARVVKLAEAVKMARETANVTPVDDPKPGKAIFDYVFG